MESGGRGGFENRRQGEDGSLAEVTFLAALFGRV